MPKVKADNLVPGDLCDNSRRGLSRDLGTADERTLFFQLGKLLGVPKQGT